MVGLITDMVISCIYRIHISADMPNLNFLNQNILENAGCLIREWHFFHFDLKCEGLLSRDGLVQE